MRRPLSAWRAFASDDNGTILVAFTLLLPTLILIIGGAIDFGRAYILKQRMQLSIDAAVIFRASSQQTTVPGAISEFEANFKSTEAKKTKIAIRTNADGSVTGVVSSVLPTTFLKIMMMEEMPISVSATATPRQINVTELTFAPLSAKGWFPKDIFAFVRTAEGRIKSMQQALAYDFDWGTRQGAITPAVNSTTVSLILQNGETFGVMMQSLA